MDICKTINSMVKNYRRVIYRVSYILFFLYSCLMIWEVFIGPYRSFAGTRRYNIYPFKTIIEYLFNATRYNFHVVFINLIANIVTFIPFGFLIPILSKKHRTLFNMTIISLLVIMMIEVMQFILNVGVFDIDDIILNTSGCILGYGIYRIMKNVICHNSYEQKS